MLTTWPSFTEAMYLLGEVGGYTHQAELWKMRQAGRLALYDLSRAEVDRMVTLMEKYQDRPMDLADSSLVVVAESLGLRNIFSLDHDFHIYRLSNGSRLEVTP